MLEALNAFLWHNFVLFLLLGTGILFTVWSGFCQYRSLTHGIKAVRGDFDNKSDPGAISHFQALAAALSATVGLGNIGGVALAIALGGPGAVFWMWVVGFFGMSIKLTEVTLSMLYRNTHDPDNPHGGPMWVISKGLAARSPALAGTGKWIAILFCITCLISTATGGNMFQSWNVAELTEVYFGVPSIYSGIVLALLVGAVIIGGIKRIGAVAGTLVPFMLALYFIAGLYVIAVNIESIPSIFALIIKSAFSHTEASGAFLGGTMGYAFLFGMKRALFSNEAGQGTSPIAHAAAKTNEPVREGVVAGLEPFIDTLVVCTVTAMVILSTGIWNRGAEGTLTMVPDVVAVSAGEWSLAPVDAPPRNNGGWMNSEQVFIVLKGEQNLQAGNQLHRLSGTVIENNDGSFRIRWDSLSHGDRPEVLDGNIYVDYVGATMTAKAFDVAMPGLGKWLVTLAAWLFAFSTCISWSYYGEQSAVFLGGEKAVIPYKIIFCILTVVASMDFLTTSTELDNLTGFGTGVMLFVNVPIMWLFGRQAMRAYKDYIRRLKKGEMTRHT
jgi:AGCS family alanine or glycine:cation symporter